jgi:type IX secretion system PorP/SprF family membrane protein
VRISIHFFLFFFFGSVIGQSYFSYYPVQFGQYIRHYQFINPASIGARSNFETVLGSKNNIGDFSNISTYFAGVSFSVLKSSKTGKPFNVAGLKVDTDREGKYIARTRAYVMYAFHFKIFRDYYLSGGVDLGILNMSVQGTPSTGDKSEYVPDANTGIWFYNEGFYFGFSVNQVFNGRLQPYQEVSIMRRHFNIIAMKRFEINRLVSISPSVILRYPSYLNYNADYSVECRISDFLGGFSIRHKQGIAFWLGITEIKLAGGGLEAVILYNTPLKKSLININSIELVCRYEL